jgi:hypothetical protein
LTLRRGNRARFKVVGYWARFNVKSSRLLHRASLSMHYPSRALICLISVLLSTRTVTRMARVPRALPACENLWGWCVTVGRRFAVRGLLIGVVRRPMISPTIRMRRRHGAWGV